MLRLRVAYSRSERALARSLSAVRRIANCCAQAANAKCTSCSQLVAMCSFAAFSVAQGATLLSAQALEPCCAKTRSRGLRRALAGWAKSLQKIKDTVGSTHAIVRLHSVGKLRLANLHRDTATTDTNMHFRELILDYAGVWPNFGLASPCKQMRNFLRFASFFQKN